MSVVRERVPWVVPEGSEPVGEPLEGTGGLGGGGGDWVVTETEDDWEETLAGVAES